MRSGATVDRVAGHPAASAGSRSPPTIAAPAAGDRRLGALVGRPAAPAVAVRRAAVPRLADVARGAIDLALAPGDRADLPGDPAAQPSGTLIVAESPSRSLWNAIIALVAGVSVFGLENRRRTYRFLVHHGARPGLVWLAKLVTWCFGLALIWAPLAYLSPCIEDPVPDGPAASRAVGTLFALDLPLVFAVAVLCGMAIPRGITAGVVALVIALALAGGRVGLLAIGHDAGLGAAGPAAGVPGGHLGLERRLAAGPPGARALGPARPDALAAVLATVFGGYTGWRAWSVPDVGPIPMPSAWAAASAPLPPRPQRGRRSIARPPGGWTCSVRSSLVGEGRTPRCRSTSTSIPRPST